MTLWGKKSSKNVRRAVARAVQPLEGLEARCLMDGTLLMPPPILASGIVRFDAAAPLGLEASTSTLKFNTGTLRLTPPGNTYIDFTRVIGGNLVLNDAASSTLNAGSSVFSTTTTNPNAINFSGVTLNQGAGTINLVSNPNLSGNVVLNSSSAVAASGTLKIPSGNLVLGTATTNPNTINLSGVILSQGAGTINLGSNLNLSGGLVLNSGYLGNANLSGSLSGTDLVIVNGAFTASGGTMSSGVVTGATVRYAGTDFATQYQAALSGQSGTLSQATSTVISYTGNTTEKSLLTLQAAVLQGNGQPFSNNSTVSWPAESAAPASATANLKVYVPQVYDSLNISGFTGSLSLNRFGGGWIAAKPTGRVTFYDGNTVLGTGTIGSNGIASLQLAAPLTFGAHRITAMYAGDANFVSSTSDAGLLNITHGTTNTVLTVPPGPVIAGSWMALSATVTTAENQTYAPTGQFTFFDGNQVLGVVPASTTVCLVKPMTVGVHTFTVVYSDDANYYASAASSTVLCGVPAATLSAGYDLMATGNFTTIHTLVGRGRSMSGFVRIV
ncbi:MAG: Ig-like domain repeat protein [Phycisphaerae bacterium]